MYLPLFPMPLPRTVLSVLHRAKLLTLQGFRFPTYLYAYREGETWLNELRKYLTDNLHYVYAYLMKYLPEIRLVEPEGTYLLWLDCRNLKMTEKERIDAIENKGKLWLDTGSMFGEAGTGYERINIACPRATLEECLNRLRKAFS